MISANFYPASCIAKYPAFKSGGYDYSTSSKPKRIATGVASFLIPGLGQVINGETSKGIATFLAIFCNSLLFLRNRNNLLIGSICDLGLRCWAAYDAYKKA